MRKLILDQSDILHTHLPSVSFDNIEGVFKVYGYLLQDKEVVDVHFKKINQWIDIYLCDPNSASNFYFCFYCIHSYGVMCIVELICKIKNLPGLKVYWVLHPDDRDMEELVCDISLEVGLEIELIKSTNYRLIEGI